GSAFADRWPEPSVVAAGTGGNYALRGGPAGLSDDDVRRYIKGFVEAPASFAPILSRACPGTAVWDRIIFSLASPPLPPAAPAGYEVRRLTADDGPAVAALSDETAWISKTWGGPAGLASSGMAWGAFAGERLVSVACSFFVGDVYEDIGVAT